MYENISEKKDTIVKTVEVRTNKFTLKLDSLTKKFEKTKNMLVPIAITRQTKPISELINIFYSNNQYFLNRI